MLQDISLDIEKKDFISIIGPSGCGKSTLLKLVSNLIKPDKGEISIAGSSEQKNMSFVFQDANLLPWLNLRDNIALPLKLAKASQKQINEKSKELLDLVGLAPYKHYYPREMSGGMRMRASIARALTIDPELLLLDEPFGALDEMTRDDLNEALLRLRKKKPWTAMFVTHSVVESVFLGNKVLVLSANPGRIYKTIDVEFSYPRTSKLRTTSEFVEKVREVTEALHSLRKPAYETLVDY